MTTTVPVKIKLFDSTLPVPEYHSSQAAGFDFYSRLDLTLPAHQVTLVPTGVAMSYPSSYWLLIAARSSLHKLGLQPINGIGVVDPDYCGDNDEIRLLIYNFSNQTVKIKKGDRLAQGVLVSRTKAKFTIVPHLQHPNRGGLGSTGQ